MGGRRAANRMPDANILQVIDRSFRRHGLTFRERFWLRAERSPAGCLIWKGSKCPDGYGQLRVLHRAFQAHRVAWALEHGRDPGAAEVCHSCDTPACVEPAHLWLGDHAANVRDAAAKGRMPRGERARSAKLTSDQAIAIFNDPRRRAVLAREYQIAPQNIWAIKTGRAWAHVTGGRA